MGRGRAGHDTHEQTQEHHLSKAKGRVFAGEATERVALIQKHEEVCSLHSWRPLGQGLRSTTEILKSVSSSLCSGVHVTILKKNPLALLQRFLREKWKNNGVHKVHEGHIDPGNVHTSLPEGVSGFASREIRPYVSLQSSRMELH